MKFVLINLLFLTLQMTTRSWRPWSCLELSLVPPPWLGRRGLGLGACRTRTTQTDNWDGRQRQKTRTLLFQISGLTSGCFTNFRTKYLTLKSDQSDWSANHHKDWLDWLQRHLADILSNHGGRQAKAVDSKIKFAFHVRCVSCLYI